MAPAPVPFRAPRGMPDLRGRDLDRLRFLEREGLDVLSRQGFEEIRVPLVEWAPLFARAAGETSDVAEKQMFIIPTADGDPYALRPEATAGVVRAAVERSLLKERPFVRLCYAGPMFRYERPQAARQRQFHQVGGEMLGSAAPTVDVACVGIAADVLRAAGLRTFATRVNTIGCRACRPGLREALRAAIGAARESLCENCLRRIDANPLRVLDCGRPGCRAVAESLPRPRDLVCADCAGHFAAVLEGLRVVGEPFQEDPLLVRGLDYYTRTLFEFRVPELGARDAVGGGGRYDDLVEDLGGPATPAIGFSVGLEATLLAIEKTGAVVVSLPLPGVDVFVAVPAGDDRNAALRLAREVRALGLGCDLDLEGRSLRAQLKAADRSGAGVCLLLGPDEEERGVVRWKPLRGGGEEQDIPRAEALLRLGARVDAPGRTQSA